MNVPYLSHISVINSPKIPYFSHIFVFENPIFPIFCCQCPVDSLIDRKHIWLQKKQIVFNQIDYVKQYFLILCAIDKYQNTFSWSPDIGFVFLSKLEPNYSFFISFRNQKFINFVICIELHRNSKVFSVLSQALTTIILISKVYIRTWNYSKVYSEPIDGIRIDR